MRKPPEPLWEEEQHLIEEFFSQFSDEEMKREMTDEEDTKFHEKMNRWLDEHASEELRLYWDYGNWVGDEGQLCDGKGNILLLDSNDCCSWIQDWDVNEDGYCVYEGTHDLILNTDGTPIKHPVLDKRVEDLY